MSEANSQQNNQVDIQQIKKEFKKNFGENFVEDYINSAVEVLDETKNTEERKKDIKKLTQNKITNKLNKIFGKYYIKNIEDFFEQEGGEGQGATNENGKKVLDAFQQYFEDLDIDFKIDKDNKEIKFDIKNTNKEPSIEFTMKDNGENKGFIVDTKVLVPLKELKKKPEEKKNDKEEDKKKKKSNNLIIALIVALVVLTALLSLFLILYNKYKKDKQADEEKEKSEHNERNEQTKNGIETKEKEPIKDKEETIEPENQGEAIDGETYYTEAKVATENANYTAEQKTAIAIESGEAIQDVKYNGHDISFLNVDKNGNCKFFDEIDQKMYNINGSEGLTYKGNEISSELFSNLKQTDYQYNAGTNTYNPVINQGSSTFSYDSDTGILNVDYKNTDGVTYKSYTERGVYEKDGDLYNGAGEKLNDYIQNTWDNIDKTLDNKYVTTKDTNIQDMYRE